MSKKNGKLESVEIGSLPIQRKRLTPKQALVWLDEEYPGYNELLSAARGVAEEADEGAIGMAELELQYLVEACTKAIRTGRGFAIDSSFEFSELRNRRVTSQLRDGMLIVQAVARRIRMEPDELYTKGYEALEKIATVLARLAQSASVSERAENDRRHAEAKAAKKANAPEIRSERLHRRRKAVQKERDAMLQKIAKPWEQRLASLEYEALLLDHEAWGCEHPGPPPKGYKPEGEALA